MWNRIIIGGAVAISLLSLFSTAMPVSAGAVVQTETCNVTVTFRATVPNSVEQGKSFTITGITVQPSNSYNFTVSSSIFDMTATNTSSTTYSQNFITTNPTPTTGHSTYQGIYPNWSLNATGPAGSSMVIKLKKSVTVVQGYGTVTCNFTKTLATIPIVAPTPPSPSPSPSPSSSPNPSSSPSSTPKPSSSSTPSSTPKASSSASPDPKVAADEKSIDKAIEPAQEDGSGEFEEQSITVVPLIVRVRDSSGKIVVGAEVTLNGTLKAKTDSRGSVTFSNVLTGGHNILVSYKGQKVDKSFFLDSDDVGKAYLISLPPSTESLNLLLIGGGVAGATGLAGLGIFLALKRKRKLAKEAADKVPSAISLPGIMAGSAAPAPTARTDSTIPAIPVFAAPSTALTPAPWDLAPGAMPASPTAQAVAPVAATVPASPVAQQQPAPAPATTIPPPIAAAVVAPVPVAPTVAPPSIAAALVPITAASTTPPPAPQSAQPIQAPVPTVAQPALVPTSVPVAATTAPAAPPQPAPTIVAPAQPTPMILIQPQTPTNIPPIASPLQPLPAITKF